MNNNLSPHPVIPLARAEHNLQLLEQRLRALHTEAGLSDDVYYHSLQAIRARRSYLPLHTGHYD